MLAKTIPVRTRLEINKLIKKINCKNILRKKQMQKNRAVDVTIGDQNEKVNHLSQVVKSSNASGSQSK